MATDEPVDELVYESLEEWLANRPQVIKDLAASHPPDGEYRLANDPDGDSYQVYSYNEDGTIKVIRYMRLADSMVPMWTVFGMRPEDLVLVRVHEQG